MPISEKRRESYKKWYKKNKAAFNASRKIKYQNDPALQAKAAAASKKRRQMLASQARVHTRLVNGSEQQVFRIGDAAQMIGRDEQTIRKWEKCEWIPVSNVEGRHRYYTMHQIELLAELAQLIDELRYPTGREVMKLAIQKKSAEIHQQWEQTEEKEQQRG